jgi:hypothetical protein
MEPKCLGARVVEEIVLPFIAKQAMGLIPQKPTSGSPLTMYY